MVSLIHKHVLYIIIVLVLL